MRSKTITLKSSGAGGGVVLRHITDCAARSRVLGEDRLKVYIFLQIAPGVGEDGGGHIAFGVLRLKGFHQPGMVEIARGPGTAHDLELPGCGAHAGKKRKAFEENNSGKKYPPASTGSTGNQVWLTGKDDYGISMESMNGYPGGYGDEQMLEDEEEFQGMDYGLLDDETKDENKEL